jgi:hypothetical protein
LFLCGASLLGAECRVRSVNCAGRSGGREMRIDVTAAGSCALTRSATADGCLGRRGRGHFYRQKKLGCSPGSLAGRPNNPHPQNSTFKRDQHHGHHHHPPTCFPLTPWPGLAEQPVTTPPVLFPLRVRLPPSKAMHTHTHRFHPAPAELLRLSSKCHSTARPPPHPLFSYQATNNTRIKTPSN